MHRTLQDPDIRISPARQLRKSVRSYLFVKVVHTRPLLLSCELHQALLRCGPVVPIRPVALGEAASLRRRTGRARFVWVALRRSGALDVRDAVDMMELRAHLCDAIDTREVELA